MELVLLEIGSPEWDYAWKWLGENPINKGIENPTIALNENEAWMYMASYMQDDKIIHSFRHRHHPVTQGVKTLSVSGSKKFTKEQIAKKFRL